MRDIDTWDLSKGVLHVPVVVRTMGGLLLFLAAALLVPALTGAYYLEMQAALSFFTTATVAGALGGAAWWGIDDPGEDALRVREGFVIVALAWAVLSAVGALPFIFGGVLESYTDAYFETISGFTTTGATIFGGGGNMAISAMPRAHMLWRSLAHWMGGMGIIVLTLAILPILGVGGMQLFKAEVPGPSADKLTPRIRETARKLWLIYVAITGVQIALLTPAIGLFEAVNHAFATMATGGFSTQDASVAGLQSVYVEWVIIVFMFLAGMNFVLHFRLLRGNVGIVAKDTELRTYAGIVGGAALLITVATWRPLADLHGAAFAPVYEGFHEAVRVALFQVISLVTTTGFATADYELWPPLAIGVVFLLFFVGGMAGSTGGGVKVIRHVLLYKNSFKDLRQLVHPQAILPVRLNGSVVPDDVMRNVLSFMVCYAGLIAVGTFLLFCTGVDLLTAIGGVLSCLGNIGPGFGTLGPTENYAHLSMFAKWVLSFLMLAGRLELFTVLVLFAPTFWRP
ncbi:TrkH family potassium uptake protein [Salisaeta longa]|uniref:TrkH family potassium uptake protein n=1 Tax=Salisaeta longa TaxID=503170 RepID=UPI0003B335B3|nr:potassium transporter TrkG [Salisaeta longa]